MRLKKARKELFKDFVLICIGALLAIILARIGFIDWVISFLGGQAPASFVAGLFFTSVFSIAPATLALAHLAHTIPPVTIALWGALGATCGDLVLFLFIRDRFTDDLMSSLRPSVARHILRSFHFGFLKWLAPLFGALIIASPLPDELGLTLMGISKTRIIVLLPIAFVMNMIGIYAIARFALLVY